MLFYRKLGKVVFGKATPTQIMLACVLGAMLGFMPGFVQAPGLIALFTVLIVLLNLPLPLAGLTGLVGGLLSLALMPVSFTVGRALLDGPTQPLFTAAINAPVLAWFGLEYYATTGGLVLGLAFGIVAGLLVVRGVKRVRHRLADLEENSERYQQWMSKKWVRVLSFVLVGGLPKDGFKSLLEQKRGKLIRPLGVAIAVGVVVVGVLVNLILAEPLVTHGVRTALERANGATVDLDSVDLDLRNGRITLYGLAMADRNDLETDLLRAEELNASVSRPDLLRKRVTLDEVVLTEARHGEPRRAPGRIVGPRPSPPPHVEPGEGERTLEDFIADAQAVYDRLHQLQEWLERLAGSDAQVDPDAPAPDGVDPSQRPDFRERLRQRVAEQGYGGVRAEHLVRGRPTVTILDLYANGVRSRAMEDELLDVHAQHLSSHPHLHEHPPRVHVESRADSLLLNLHMAGLARGATDQQNTLELLLRNVAVDALLGRFAQGSAPISGGTADFTVNGTLATHGGIFVDLPVSVSLHNSVVQIGGQPADIESLTVPFGVRGPVARPRVTLDDEQVMQAMLDAGAGALTGRARQEAGRALERATGGLGGRLGSQFFGGGSDAAGDPEPDEQEEGEAVERQIEDAAGDAFRGLFGGGD